MLEASIGWFLIASGAATAAGGLAGAFAPRPLLRFVFGVAEPDGATLFFTRHWGILIFAVGALLVASGPAAHIRFAVLPAAALEKFAVVYLVFFGPLTRTKWMSAAAAFDGAFALIYCGYLLIR